MLQHISEVDGLPEIGKKYWVPCASAYRNRQHTPSQIIKNIPIIGTMHQDKFYFDVEWKHTHFDARFVTGEVKKMDCRMHRMGFGS